LYCIAFSFPKIVLSWSYACGYSIRFPAFFNVGSKEKVDSITKQMQADGYDVISGPGTTVNGYYESCVADPEGHHVHS